MSKIVAKILYYIPATITTLFEYTLQVENNHYGFAHPGLDYDSTLVVLLLCFVSCLLAMLMTIKNTASILNRLFPYLIHILALVRFAQIFVIFSSYLI